jgi:GNAT superfamily N-acetyltransferase
VSQFGPAPHGAVTVTLEPWLRSDQKAWRPTLVKYDDDEQRDERGRWTDGGGESGGAKVEGGNATKARLGDLSKELDAQGVPADHPIRGVIDDSRGDQLAIARDPQTNKITGAMAYTRSTRDWHTTYVTDLRTMGKDQGKGVGQALMQHAAQDAAGKKDGDVFIRGAVQTAIPFYQRMGAHFNAEAGRENLAGGGGVPAHFTSSGRIEGEDLRALAAGKPNDRTITAVEQIEKENAEMRARYPDYTGAPQEGAERNKPINQQAYDPLIVAVDPTKVWVPRLVKYSPDQPRDPDGRFGEGGGSPPNLSVAYAAQQATLSDADKMVVDDYQHGMNTVVNESDLIHTPARTDKAYNEDQPRDDHGRWSSEGGGGDALGGRDKPADYDPKDPLTAFPAGPQRDMMREMQERMSNPKPWDPALALGGPEMIPQRDIAAYLKDHGQEWTAQKLPEGIDRGPAKECYMNATHLVMDDPAHLRYCEGYVTDPEAAGFSFMHGWAVTEDGKVIDPTLPHSENCTYWGVAYPTDKYLSYIQDTKVFGVLGGTEKDARAVIARGGLP